MNSNELLGITTESEFIGRRVTKQVGACVSVQVRKEGKGEFG
jgi:hypothetical protein